MVDSRDKGSRAELTVRDFLRKETGLKWERVPGSGGLNEVHLLKGDLYIPGYYNHYVVEVKHYAEDHLTSEILTSSNPTLLKWWDQAIRQGEQVDKFPLLIFKFDRSKLFAGYSECFHPGYYKHIHVNIGSNPFYIAQLTDYLQHEKPTFV